MLIAVAYYGHKRDYELSPEESESLRCWVLVANAKGRYSRGSSETILDQDIATLRDGGGGVRGSRRAPSGASCGRGAWGGLPPSRRGRTRSRGGSALQSRCGPRS